MKNLNHFDKVFKKFIASLNSMKPLPVSKAPYYLQFKLEYFDEIAPNDYKVDGFVPYTESISNKTTFSTQNEAVYFEDATINTGHHSVGIQIEAEKSNIDQAKIHKFNLNIKEMKNEMKNLKRPRDINET